MLDDKVCLVTGAGSGMGRATALEMSRQGARAVVVCDVNDDAGQATADAVDALGATGLYVHCDVSSSDQVATLMASVEENFGVLDVLHNNAGIIDVQLTDASTLDETDEWVWDRIFAVNVKGSWLCIKLGTPLLAKSTAGVIVNCASVASYLHFETETAYVASKSAILGLTRTAAVDLAPLGIRCVAYAPGTIDTPMNASILDAVEDREVMVKAVTATHLVPRLGAAEDIAKLVCFLASDDAAFITGSCHVIDGGVLAWRGAKPS